MSNPSFESGDEKKIRVRRRDGSWYLDSPKSESTVVCLFKHKEPSSDSRSQEIDVRVVNYRQSYGDGSDYLTVRLRQENGGGQQQSSETTTQTDSTSSSPEQFESSSTSRNKSYPERNLIQFDGSGDYVTVEARVLKIEFVEKGTRDMPDVRGVLGEKESIKKLPFVVTDDTPHPYFEEGKRFRFEGVKDHEYTHKNETQALITENTNIIELD